MSTRIVIRALDGEAYRRLFSCFSSAISRSAKRSDGAPQIESSGSSTALGFHRHACSHGIRHRARGDRPVSRQAIAFHWIPREKRHRQSMSKFRRIEKMSESNIDCFSTQPKNGFVYFPDWHAACFSWVERPARSPRIISALRADPILSPAWLTLGSPSRRCGTASIGESRIDNCQGSMDGALFPWPLR
jgi:hypothetical protein